MHWLFPDRKMLPNESFVEWLDRTESDPYVQNLKEFRKLQDKLLRSRALEVNHIVPVLGKHSETGCHHHQENLEVLCHTCHVEETRSQRQKGLLKKESK